ncbi:MAG TPA: metallophosphoesterase [Desulfobacteraceae bacterium]|nr:metallophosphoesterase [Desulfobacteraceae bacterium]HPJ67229.1 metallophosphoesterase [Desulfobacteraceae bacterium]HPQ27391.1 metallophosphoesterase [Desulfobacteraceae bacterium]
MNYAFVHVADIHYRKDAPEGAASIMKAFLEDLGKQTNALPNHQFYIAFAGDTVRAGEDFSAFEAFIREIDGQLDAIGLEKDVRIIVPGNHDLNRRAVENTFDQCIQAYEERAGEEENFNDFIDKSTLLTGHFSNYEKFVRQFARCDESFKACGWGCKLSEDVGVYCLNTSLCSFGGLRDIKDEGRLACYTRDLVDWCGKTAYPVRILLHHHPLDHLNSWSQTELQHIIENNFTICLSGHNHLPELFYSHVPQKALMCTAPPLFCGKESLLAYSIILVENNAPSAILYREYSGGTFFPSHRLAKADNGRVELENPYLRHLREMELQLQHALEAFKGQPSVFVEPTLSKKREFNDDPNELPPLIESPCDTLIIAPREFGLTCLGLHMRIEAFKKNNFWLYIDAEHTKARKISDLIDEELLHYNRGLSDLKCIVLDSWDAGSIDHLTMVKNIVSKLPDIPLVILAEDSLVLDATGNLSKLNKDFKLLHLQALSRNSMRQLVAGYNATKQIGTEDIVLSGLAEHLEAINVHRTPLNCYTLLRVLDSSYNEKLLNKTKLLKAILFVLFTDSDSFSYLSSKPEVEECSYVLGRFCMDLIKNGTRSFDTTVFAPTLDKICKSACITLDIDAMLNVLLENNILVKQGNQMQFRHRYWIFYFAAEWMRHDNEFRQFILTNRNYINYPEIIEFYSGIDGKRADAMETLLADLTLLIDQVDNKIGIKSSFDPLTPLLWNPTDEYIEKARSQIAEKVESSNLPAEIKDKHADLLYQSEAPYDQSIRRFLNDYSVLSLLHSIKAASRALRNSPFVDVELRLKAITAILGGWEEISRVAFWLSPLLAAKGQAVHDGFALRLAEGFSSDLDQRFKQIIVANPCNIVRILGGDLASKKIGPLLCECIRVTDSKLQKHMMALFIATVRPIGWYEATLNHINLLHPRSFYLGDIFGRLTDEVTFGNLEQGEELALKQLTGAILSKREYAPKVSDAKEIPPNKVLSEENEIPIDKLLKGNRRKWPSM